MGLNSNQIKRIAGVLNKKATSKGAKPIKKRSDVSRGQYYQYIKSVAEDIKDAFTQYGTDVNDLVFQAVDGSEYIIYYAKNLDVLQASDNDDAISDAGVQIDTSKGWQNILTQVAYYAMEADVNEALSELGWDGDSFGEAEVEEEI